MFLIIIFFEPLFKLSTIMFRLCSNITNYVMFGIIGQIVNLFLKSIKYSLRMFYYRNKVKKILKVEC
jgi:hypothetical protein